jgi:hypothetical protein
LAATPTPSATGDFGRSDPALRDRATAEALAQQAAGKDSSDRTVLRIFEGLTALAFVVSLVLVLRSRSERR